MSAILCPRREASPSERQPGERRFLLALAHPLTGSFSPQAVRQRITPDQDQQMALQLVGEYPSAWPT
jgi:hypothetical protein